MPSTAGVSETWIGSSMGERQCGLYLWVGQSNLCLGMEDSVALENGILVGLCIALLHLWLTCIVK